MITVTSAAAGEGANMHCLMKHFCTIIITAPISIKMYSLMDMGSKHTGRPILKRITPGGQTIVHILKAVYAIIVLVQICFSARLLKVQILLFTLLQ
ncbi:hypothetical protein GZ77_12300 [Endozoicomonas montiporae]|uniref:Uncharacterized protein n=1 Tax=Endozoicomonas montiporae TaxID=1027273 RepID=A0A081N447_9GAMM|nr:hypothetical protein GZ77_12300 [Endozoicomonas montiporae]